jgi:hypothetical protein
LGEAVAEADSWDAVCMALRARDPNGEDERVRVLFAFGYALFERSSDRRDRAGGPFGAMISGDRWGFPPALTDIETADVQVWAAAFEWFPVIESRRSTPTWAKLRVMRRRVFSFSAWGIPGTLSSLLRRPGRAEAVRPVRLCAAKRLFKTGLHRDEDDFEVAFSPPRCDRSQARQT